MGLFDKIFKARDSYNQKGTAARIDKATAAPKKKIIPKKVKRSGGKSASSIEAFMKNLVKEQDAKKKVSNSLAKSAR